MMNLQKLFSDARALGLTPARLSLLACMTDGAPRKSSEIARVMGVSCANLTRLISDMTTSGWLVPHDTTDGRVKAVALSGKSMQFLANAQDLSLR